MLFVTPTIRPQKKKGRIPNFMSISLDPVSPNHMFPLQDNLLGWIATANSFLSTRWDKRRNWNRRNEKWGDKERSLMEWIHLILSLCLNRHSTELPWRGTHVSKKPQSFFILSEFLLAPFPRRSRLLEPAPDQQRALLEQN